MNSSIDESERLKKERMINNLLNEDLKILIPYLEEETVTDIAITDSGEIIITRFGQGREFTGKHMPDYMAERIVKGTAAVIGKSLDTFTGYPILEGIIPKYNSRITAMMKPNCIRTEIQIRQPPKRIYSLENYVEKEQMTQEQYEIIVSAIKNRKNIVVSGSTGSGKTTCTNAIIKKMTELYPQDNFYIIEDTPELQCVAQMKTMLWIAKEHARKAVEESLRFSPDRIIFGEVRNSEVMIALLDAWRTGHSGNVTTIHANDGASTLMRIKSMVKNDSYTAEHLSEIINLIVHFRKVDNEIRCDEIYPVTNDTDNFLAGIIQNNLG